MTITYPVNEVFTSIDGEINPWHQGRPTTFIRLQGCNLECPYCDTKKSWEKTDNNLITVDTIIDLMIYGHRQTDKVTITGGEPLLHNLTDMIERLTLMNYDISIETNGTVGKFQPYMAQENVSLIIDIKLPSSNINEDLIKIDFIKQAAKVRNTWFKFLVKNNEDFLRAIQHIRQYALPQKKCAFSPILNKNGTPYKNAWSAKKLLGAMLDMSHTQSILNIQIHKFVGMD